jgi:hypothetical protein
VLVLERELVLSEGEASGPSKMGASGARVTLVGELPESEAAMNTGEGSCRGDGVVAAWSGSAGLSVVAA